MAAWRSSGLLEGRRNLLGAGLLALLLLVPLLYALLAAGGVEGGQAAAVAPIYCQEGLNPVGAVLIGETVALLALTAGAYALPGVRNGWAAGLRTYGVQLVVLLALIAIPFIIAWQTDSSVCSRGRSFFWQSVFIEVFILGALAISYNLIFGFAGVLSFGHAAFFGVGAYGVGLLIRHLEWPLGWAVLGTLAASVLMGVLVSVIALRIRGLYFAIFTLTFAEIFFVLAQNRIMTRITGAEDGFTFSVPDWINATQHRMTFYYLALGFLVFCYLLVRQLINSPTGRVMRAMRENEDRAMMLGYNTFAYKMLAIVLAGVLASGAGILRGLLNKGASPNVLGASFTIDPLLMTLIGGVATFAGPVVGAFLLRLMEQYLRDTVVHAGPLELNIGEHWYLLLGLIFILIVIAFPSGIVGTVQNWRRRWQARKKDPPEPEPAQAD